MVRRHVGRGRQRPLGGQQLGQPERVDAPEIPGVNAGGPGIDEREPAPGLDAGRTVFQHLSERAAAGHFPAGQAPIARPVSAQDHREVDGPVDDRRRD